MLKSTHFDIAIIGSGPGGLMNAYKNVLSNRKVLLIEAGRKRAADHCNINNLTGHCADCTPCNNISGFGGCAAPNNSMKLSFPPSGKRLTAMFGSEACDKLGKSFWDFYSKFAEINLPFPKSNYNNEQITQMIKKMGADFFSYPIHIFSEAEHTNFLKNVHSFLSERCKILLNTSVNFSKDINIADKTININGNKATFSNLIIATGRKGYRNTNIFAQELGVERTPENVNIGFRVLLPAQYLKKLSQIHPDYKLKQKNANTELETFCFCCHDNGGRLEFARYDDFLNVDGQMAVKSRGHVINDKQYGNFAVLFENKAHPIRYDDFVSRLGKDESRFEYNVENWHKFNQNGIFKEEESKALKDFVDDFLGIIARENNVHKSDLYKEMRIVGPEVENIWSRNKKLWVNDDIAMIGDCSGIAQGIVTAGMMGEAVTKLKL